MSTMIVTLLTSNLVEIQSPTSFSKLAKENSFCKQVKENLKQWEGRSSTVSTGNEQVRDAQRSSVETNLCRISTGASIRDLRILSLRVVKIVISSDISALSVTAERALEGKARPQYPTRNIS
uniref:Uncharacterized protein n=1 Tax=Opuntia streptacantha TaxID=393608 RepID=A0A7C9CRM9_OPUST